MLWAVGLHGLGGLASKGEPASADSLFRHPEHEKTQ